jgi:hypothetical protein
MAVTLPPGWTIQTMTEDVPDPNTGLPFFRRITHICRDQGGQYVCSSGSLEDCEAQALTAAQSFTQQRPYDTVR